MSLEATDAAADREPLDNVSHGLCKRCEARYFSEPHVVPGSKSVS
jgi:hypothetical protein